MRRTLWGALLVAGLGGCRSPEVFLRPQVTLRADVNGAVLDDGWGTGHLGMLGTTCSFSIEEGLLLGDVDLPGADRVHDGYDGRALVSSADAVHVVDFQKELERYESDPVVAAVLTDRGPVTLERPADGCAVVFHAGAGSVPVPVDACDAGELAASRDGADAFVVVAKEAWRVSGGGAAPLGVPAERLLWHDRARVLVTAADQHAYGVERTGERRWRTDVGERIDDLLRLGAEVAVITPSRVVVIDPRDGSVHAESTEPVPPGDPVGSEDGTVMGFGEPGWFTVWDVSIGSLEPADPGPDVVEQMLD